MIKLFKYLFYVCLIVLGFLIYSCAEEVDEQNTIEHWAANNSIYTKILSSSNGSDIGKDVLFDSKNNIYIAGYTSGSMDGGTFTNTNIGGIKSDIFISKMNSNLDKIWSIQFEPTTGDMETLNLLIDKNDNIYVHGTGTHPNLYKYNSDGNLINTITMPVSGDITIDNSGNVLIGGNLKLYKFNESGVNIWNNVSYEHDPFVKIQTDSLNYVYVLHHNQTTRRITKFHPNSNNEGVLLNLDGITAGDFTIDNENNIIVSALDGGQGGIYKYNSSGSQLWTNSYNPELYNIENDDLGNIYATRGSRIKKLSSSGSDVWLRDFNLGVYNSNEFQGSNLIINNNLFSIYVIGTTSSYIGTNGGSPPNVFITRTWTYKTVKE